VYTLKFPKIEQNMHMRRPTGDYIPNKCSEVAEMGESLATIDMAENWRAVPFLRGRGPHLTQCGLGRGLLSCQVASSSIQPFGHNRHVPKIGEAVPGQTGQWSIAYSEPFYKRSPQIYCQS